MTPQIVSLIVSGLAVLLILVQVFVGAIRGLKKSTFRLVWVFVWGSVCVIAATLIAKTLVNFDFSFLHLKVNGIEVSTLPQYIEKTLEASNPDVANMIADNPKILELCTSIACMVLSLVLFEVLFWVTKILLWPIWAIFSHIFFGKKKNKNNEEKEIGRKLSKSKKHAGLGALVGLGLGLIVCMFTFVPLHFINKSIMLVEAETATVQGDGTTKGIISQALGENSKYITVYEDSYVAKAFKYTGISVAQDLMGDALTSVKFDGENISLSKEISTFAPIYKDYIKISSYDSSTLSKDNISEILPVIDDAQSRVLSSNLVKSVYNELAPYLAKNILTNPDYFIKLPDFENEYLNSIVKDTLKAFFGINELGEIDQTKVIKIDDIKNDISKLIDIAGTVNQTNLLADAIAGNITFDNVKTQITLQLGESVVDKFFEMKTISTLVPVVVEPTIKFGIEHIPSFDNNGEEVKVVYTAKADGVTVESLKSFLKSLVSNSIAIVKDVNTETMLYLTSSSLKNVGALLDSLKVGDVLSTETYNSLFNYGITYANKMIDEKFPNQNPDDPEDEEYQNDVNVIGKSLISSISDINNSVTTDFRAEFIKLTNMFDFASSILDSEDVAFELLKEENLKQIAINIDELIADNSLIFSKANCAKISGALLEKLNLDDFEPYKAQIKSNLENVVSYQDEISYLFDFLGAEIDSIESLREYLADNLIDEEGKSKSKILTIDLMYDIITDAVPNIEIVDLNIKEDIKSQLQQDKLNGESILDVFDQVISIQSIEFDTSKNVEDMDSSYIGGLGQQIDNLAVEYNLIINQTSVNKIGYKVAELINNKVQEKTELGTTKLAELEEIYNNRENKTLYPNFEALFTAYADKLFE